MTHSTIQQRLSQAYVIGGSPCSGKTTIAERLTAHYGLYYYKVDDHDSEHLHRSDPILQPVMHNFTKLGWDEIWSRSPGVLCAEELTYYHERFPFILDDLGPLATDKTLLLEGAALLPQIIHQYPINRENVVFMVPTYEFQVSYYSQRPFIHAILKDCRDPERAFENWMKRDHLFGLEVIRQADHYGYPVILVDGSVNADEQFERIKTLLKLDLFRSRSAHSPVNVQDA